VVKQKIAQSTSIEKMKKKLEIVKERKKFSTAFAIENKQKWESHEEKLENKGKLKEEQNGMLHIRLDKYFAFHHEQKGKMLSKYEQNKEFKKNTKHFHFVFVFKFY
jgi:hypothetical protein